MYTSRTRSKIAILVSISMIVLVTLTCTLPSLPTSPQEPEFTETVDLTAPAGTVQPANTALAPIIPGEILTEVAATIRAQIPKQPKASPASQKTGAPPANAPQAPGPILTSTPTPTQTKTAQPARTKKAKPTASPSPTLTQIPPVIIIQPSPGGYPDNGFQVRGVNIHWCGGRPWAIFRIRNRSSLALESLSLAYQDLSASKSLSGPFYSDAPFMTTDKTCVSGGLENLAPGNTLYLGNSLGSKGLQGHKIRTTIILCTSNGLAGTCYEKVVDFVMP